LFGNSLVDSDCFIHRLQFGFFYQIDEKEKIVFMTAAAHRSDAYR
jgi:mRNA-degrading endonuclease RelE of RelBE toxin-antitoxin system